MFSNIRHDISRAFRLFDMKDTLWNKTKLLLHPGTLSVVIYRFGKWCHDLRPRVLGKVFFVFYALLNCVMMSVGGIKISCSADIGKGLSIHNFSGIFIENAVLGENCTLNCGVTVGDEISSNKGPVIGNNVYFGSGCKVMGDLTIGSNVVVGANSFVNRSVPDNCTIIGVPARIISRNPVSEYLRFE